MKWSALVGIAVFMALFYWQSQVINKSKDPVNRPNMNRNVGAETEIPEIQSIRSQLVYINYWAAWCQPCLNELPLIAQQSQLWQETEVQFVLVNLDHTPESRQEAQNYINTLNGRWISILNPSDELLALKSQNGLPYHVVLSRNQTLALQKEPKLQQNDEKTQLATKWSVRFTHLGDLSKSLQEESPNRLDLLEKLLEQNKK